ncbi:hypothetical protein GUITHDRAFT_80522, partial [Guillardia theta CCMP2712]
MRRLLREVLEGSTKRLLKSLALTDDVRSSANCLVSIAASDLPQPLSRFFLRLPGVNPNGFLCPLLHIACALGRLECVQLLLRLGASSNWFMEDYQTPLHVAFLFERYDVCRVLVAAGASIEARDGDGRAVLHTAASKGNVEAVRFLLELAADAYVVDHNGYSALHAAAEQAQAATARELLEEEPGLALLLSLNHHINAKGRDGMSALHHACQLGWLQAVELLLDKKANVEDVELETGFSCLLRAIDSQQLSAASLLVKKGANRSFVARTGTSALHLASRQGMTSVLELLLS